MEEVDSNKMSSWRGRVLAADAKRQELRTMTPFPQTSVYNCHGSLWALNVEQSRICDFANGKPQMAIRSLKRRVISRRRKKEALYMPPVQKVKIESVTSAA